VCIEGSCQPAGVLPEAGPRPDSGGGDRDAGDEMDAGEPRDAMPTDAMPTDAMPTDAMPTDAMPTDAMPTDGMAAMCETIAASWTVAFISSPAMCGTPVMGASVMITETAGMPCNFTMTNVSDPGISGTFDLASDNTLRGMLSPGTGAPASCSGSYSPADPSSFTFICGGGTCVINLSAAATP